MKDKRSFTLDRFAYVPYVLPAIAFYLIFLLVPVISKFNLSLFSWDGFSPNARFVGLRNFELLFTDPRFLQTIGNTVYAAIVGPIVQTTLALVLAVLIANVIKGKTLYRAFTYMPVILPLVAASLVWFAIYNPTHGILNSFIRLLGFENFNLAWLGTMETALPAVLAISIWRWTGFNVVIFMAGLQNISTEYYDAAKIDGASNIRIFFRITVPLLYTSLMINFALNLIGYLRIFDTIFVTTGGGPAHATSVIAIYVFNQAFRFNAVGMASAASVVLFFIIAIASVIYFRLVRRR